MPNRASVSGPPVPNGSPVRAANLTMSSLTSPIALIRRPFSLAGRRDGDAVELDIIHRVIGGGTQYLAGLVPGDNLNILGPLGNAFTLPGLDQFAILVGGGVGIPPMIYLASQLADRRAVAFAGALCRDLIPLTPSATEYEVAEFHAQGIPTILATDDGSFGFRGLITQALEEFLDGRLAGEFFPAGLRPMIYTCGPEPMMKRVAEIAIQQQHSLPGRGRTGDGLRHGHVPKLLHPRQEAGSRQTALARQRLVLPSHLHRRPDLQRRRSSVVIQCLRSSAPMRRGCRGAVLLGLSIALAGCNGIVANDLVRAQNLESPIRGKDAPQDVLDEHHVSRQLRIDVGPPPASLSVWIVDPIALPVTISIDTDAHDEPIVRLVYAPQTRPSTRPLALAARGAIVPRGTVFLLHGLGDSKEYFPYEFYSFIMAGQGYRVILVDSRGHGRSTGDRLTFGFRESRGLVQVLDELQRQGLIVGSVGVLGISYGASTAICWAAIDPRVRAVVALEPFSSLRDATVDAGPSLLGSSSWMFSNRDFQNIAARVGKLGGFDIDRDSPLAAIGAVQLQFF